VLRQVTRHLLDAARAGDLDAIPAALRIRARALDDYLNQHQLTQSALNQRDVLESVLDEGALALAAIRALKRSLRMQQARLTQIREGFLQPYNITIRFDLRA
jgi:DNA topoisomerase VI subunit B